MLGNDQNNRPFLIFLSGASLIIWGVISYQVWWGVHYEAPLPDNEPGFAVSFEDTAKTENTNKKIDFDSISRNPFHPILKKAKRRKARKPHVKSKPAPTLPPIFYVGYLGGQDKNLAIFETENGATKIVTKGDWIGEVKLLRVEATRAQVAFKKKTFFIPLKSN